MSKSRRERSEERLTRARVKLRAFDPAGSNGLALEVDVARSLNGGVELSYFILGDIGALSLPELAAPARADKLWETTCLELFVGPVGRDNYCELNFSPSSAWAAYSFSGWRSGMQNLPLAASPTIKRRESAKTLVIKASLAFGLLPGLPEEADWRIGLSAVIENQSSAKCYWALNHPLEKPDFHHKDCFALTLAPPVKP